MNEGGLLVRDILIATVGEIEVLRAELGEELEASATLRRWLAGEALPPHSVAVALETQLRMLFPEPPRARGILEALIERLAEAFPAEVQPLHTG